jgi:hypothetical protein
MPAIIISSTPAPVRWFHKLTVSSDETGRTHTVTFFVDDEGVDADTVSSEESYIPQDVLDFVVCLETNSRGDVYEK